jgi:hypothetical protein
MSRKQRLSLLWLFGVALVACLGASAFLFVRGLRAKPAEPHYPGVDEEQKAYIWDIEHHGNVLSRDARGFKTFAHALETADASLLAALLADDFKGTTLGQPVEVHVKNPFADVRRLVKANAPPEPLDRDAFVRRMMSYRSRFAKKPNVGIALMAFHPVKYGEANGRYDGTCQLRMTGDAGGGAPCEVILYLSYRVDEPSIETLMRKHWLRQADITQVQTAWAPHYLFQDVAAKRGINVNRLYDNWKLPKEKTITNTGGVYLCDYNRDGILDMLVTDVNGIFLYQGQKDGTFRDVTAQVGLPTRWDNYPAVSDSLNAWVDLDGDGWEDLILGGRLWRNDEGKRFFDFNELSNLRDFMPADGSGIIVADYDRDGKMDLYITRSGRKKADSWLTGTSGDPDHVNLLLRNKGDFQFEDVTKKSGTGGGNRSTFSAVWLDANNDGWPDLYVINEFGNGVLLINRGDGTFAEHQLGQGPWDFGSMGISCGSIANDNNIDIYCANMYSKAGNRVIGNVKDRTYDPEIMAKMRRFVTGSQLWKNEGGLHFKPVGQSYQVNGVGWAYGAALVDLDNDGFLDLFATAGFVSRDRTEPDG